MADPRTVLDVIRQRADNATPHAVKSEPWLAQMLAADNTAMHAALTAALDLAEWHETKADKARLYPGPGPENALIMTKSAAVHDDAARRLRAVIEAALTEEDS